MEFSVSTRKPETVVALLVIFSVFLLHLVIAPLVSLGVDEAHYALYALHPALSYFDHPPMVGLLQMLVAPLGYNEFTLRLIPALLYLLISWQVFRLTHIFYPKGPKWQGFIAVFLVNTAPIMQLLGWGLVPDLPLIVIALFSLEVIYRIALKEHLRDWILLGLLYGMAGLTKYTAVFLPLGMMFFMIGREGWKWLIKPGPWLAALVALIFISPVLLWNSQNDWASFTYQFDHASGGDWDIKDVLVMQVVQLFSYSFLSYIGGIAGSIYAVRRGTPADWLMITAAWPMLLVTSWSAGNGETLPNWPALGWCLLAPLTAHWVAQSLDKLRVKILILISSMISVPLILFLMFFLAFKPLATFPFMKNVIKDLVGWEQASVKASKLLETMDFAGEKPVLLVENWSRASRIAWYAHPLPVQVIGGKQSQFSFWFGDATKNSYGILIRDNRSETEDGIYRVNGLLCSEIDSFSSKLDGIDVNSFLFYACKADE